MDDSFLAIELCECIIDFAGVSNRNDGIVDYPTLLACALVCCAWLPRARCNLFYRVVLRTSAHLERFISTTAFDTATGYHVRELELGLPRWEHTDPGWMNLKEQPSIAALLYAHLTGIKTLVLSRVQWVYPRKHLRVMSQFRSVKTLELYYVRFSSPGDLAQVLWSLPQLMELRCLAVYLLHAKYPTAMVQHRLPPKSEPHALKVLKLNGCAKAGALIIHCMAQSAPWLTSLSLRGSFVSWTRDMFEALSSCHQLASLRLVLASPTVHTSLPSDTGLIGSYGQATETILLHIPADNLRRIVVSFEPGLGTLDYLSGARRPSPSSEQPPAPETEPTGWSYGSQRRTTLNTLLASSLERVVSDPDGARLRTRFAALRMLGVRIWDSKGGKDDAWWLEEVAKALPTVQKLRFLRFEVMRDWPDDESLWSDA